HRRFRDRARLLRRHRQGRAPPVRLPEPLLPSARGWLEAVAFTERETGRNSNRDGVVRFRSSAGQWGLRSEGVWVGGPHRFEAGGLFRGLTEEAVSRVYDSGTGLYHATSEYDAGA